MLEFLGAVLLIGIINLIIKANFTDDEFEIKVQLGGKTIFHYESTKK